MKDKYKAGLYCRLSKDDDNEGESSSIQTQKIMLTNYCKENNIDIYDHYVDDGYSGTNFDRPDFERMLNDIDAGNINMVITKDLSRLGRDYIMTGYYIEIYFPRKNIRYIAINDHYDSTNDNNDIAPFKNVLNDMYARDISRKIKSAKLSRAKQGLFIGSTPPYGYKKNGEKPAKLVIDPQTAPVVKTIFNMACSGYGSVKIARYLDECHIMPPSSYNKKHTKSVAETDYRIEPHWNTTMVLKILKSRVYLGEMIGHKTEVINHKTKQSRNIPLADQIITKHTHEPIIDEDLFKLARSETALRYEKTNFHTQNLFKGMVVCSVCGCQMTMGHRKDGAGYYRCMYSYRHPEMKKHNNSIREEGVKNLVAKKLSAIRRIFDKAASSKSKGIDETLLRQYIEKIVVSPKRSRKTSPEARVFIVVRTTKEIGL